MSYLCLKRDIQEGEYKVFSLFGEEIIAKKEKDRLVVAKNACKHRGFRVADKCGKGPIKCQYHGQRFGYEKSYPHHEFGEFVFVPTFLGKSEMLTTISEEIGEEFGSHKMQVKAPFHLWMQNTADPNHLGTIHKKSFSDLFDNQRPENVYLSEFESSYTMRIKDEVIEKYRKHFPDCPVDSGFTHMLGFPNLSVTSFLSVFYSIESANPNLDGCEVTTRFFMRKGLKPGLLSRMALEANIKILSEDKALVEKWAETYKWTGEDQWMQGEDRIKRYVDEIRARNLL